MVYGGTIRPGSCEGAPQLDVVSAFQAYGKHLQDGQTEGAEHERYNTIRHACPGPGACGGLRAHPLSSVYEKGIVDFADELNLDVHSQHYGECNRSTRHDFARVVFLPRGIERKARRMRFRWFCNVRPS